MNIREEIHSILDIEYHTKYADEQGDATEKLANLFADRLEKLDSNMGDLVAWETIQALIDELRDNTNGEGV